MTLSLCRIDDRLIHGQVVIGWGTPLGARLIVLVDDGVRANQWEQEIYRMALPQGVAVEFVGRDEAIARLREWDADPRRIMLITGDVETMAALVTGGEGVIRRVNLGGIHAGPGRHPCLRYVYLSEAETGRLRQLEAAGAVITAQDVPTTTPVPLHQLSG
jgi:mannose/fructose/N-acetylgalactosamine-specific phosphotransferase system component IIB